METVEVKTKKEFSFWECSCGAGWLEGLNLVYCGTCGSPRFKAVRSQSPFLVSAMSALMKTRKTNAALKADIVVETEFHCALTAGEADALLDELQNRERR